MVIITSMKCSFVLLCASACLGFGLRADDLPVELFNGKDLTNWYVFLRGRGRGADPLGVFTVTNGVIRVSGREMGCLTTEREFSDYHLRVEYRFPGGAQCCGKEKSAPDSGILFHSTGPDGGFHGVWMKSHELNLIVGATGDYWGVGTDRDAGHFAEGEVSGRLQDGKHFIHSPGGRTVRLTGNRRICRSDIAVDWSDTFGVKPASNENPRGEWNVAELVCRGEAAEFRFNGKTVNRLTRVSPAKGRIQLQSEGCPVEFRRVTLTPLGNGTVSSVGNPNRIRPLADDYVEVCRSPDPKSVYCYTPGICRLDSGRLVVTCDFGGKGVKKGEACGRIFVSDDRGATWRRTGGFPMCHARPFVAGGRLYVLGHAGNLGVCSSADDGETWSEVNWLTERQSWHQSACNVWYAKGNVYLVMERSIPSPDGRKFGWGVNRLAPTLMRARETDDLMRCESWTFADTFHFDSIFGGNSDPEIDYVGIPWYTAFTKFDKEHPRPKDRPVSQPIGWLETNVVQIRDPSHVWYDPDGKTFHLFMRANTGGSGYAAMAKVTEMPDGTMKTSLEEAPSGLKALFVPFPGGQMRFHVLWDERTRLYWLLSTQATDTFCRHDKMPARRYNLPYDERQRMQLSFSKNMMDWCFAGFVAAGKSVVESRHYAAMAIDGDDLVIVSRSGDEQAASPHNGDMITFHRVTDFRSLVY